MRFVVRAVTVGFVLVLLALPFTVVAQATSKIVYCSIDGTDHDIFIMDDDGSDVEQLTSNSVAERNPSICESSIAYERGSAGFDVDPDWGEIRLP